MDLSNTLKTGLKNILKLLQSDVREIYSQLVLELPKDPIQGKYDRKIFYTEEDRMKKRKQLGLPYVFR